MTLLMEVHEEEGRKDATQIERSISSSDSRGSQKNARIIFHSDVLRAWNSCNIDKEKRKHTVEWKRKIRRQRIVNSKKRENRIRRSLTEIENQLEIDEVNTFIRIYSSE